jgi:hypothetical protein
MAGLQGLLSWPNELCYDFRSAGRLRENSSDLNGEKQQKKHTQENEHEFI